MIAYGTTDRYGQERVERKGNPHMSELVGKSEVARFRQQLALEEEAAWLGLYGPAEVAQHERIIAYMERGAERIFRLLDEGKHEEAVELMNSDWWCFGEQQEVAHG